MICNTTAKHKTILVDVDFQFLYVGDLLASLDIGRYCFVS